MAAQEGVTLPPSAAASEERIGELEGALAAAVAERAAAESAAAAELAAVNALAARLVAAGVELPGGVEALEAIGGSLSTTSPDAPSPAAAAEDAEVGAEIAARLARLAADKEHLKRRLARMEKREAGMARALEAAKREATYAADAGWL